jgi:hypothetical protein
LTQSLELDGVVGGEDGHLLAVLTHKLAQSALIVQPGLR